LLQLQLPSGDQRSREWKMMSELCSKRRGNWLPLLLYQVLCFPFDGPTFVFCTETWMCWTRYMKRVALEMCIYSGFFQFM
jgi:hypothetical protein